MSQAKIRSALVTALTTAPKVVADTLLFWENVSDKKPSGKLWAVIQHNTNPPVPLTLGKGGFDQCTGSFFIGLTYPSNTGVNPADAAVIKLASRFVAGKVLTFEGQDVTITSAGVGTAYAVENNYRTPFTVTWRARIQRDQF